MNGGNGLRTGEVAELADVNAQTLRYYQRRGLLAEPARSPGGHRIYPPETVTLLRVIKAAQRLGFTLAEVAELLDAGRHGHHASSGLHQRAVAKLAEIDARLADLAVIRAALAEVVAAGCDDLTNCTSPDCPLPFADLASREPMQGVT
jgi:DNA-binding transcriptional MerR regulator